MHYFFVCSFTTRGHSRPYNFVAVALPSLAYTTSSVHGALAAVVQYDHNAVQPIPTQHDTNDSVNKNDTTAVLDSVLPGGRVKVHLRGLRPNTRYAMLVKAYNSLGTGPSSPAVTATTKEDSESHGPLKLHD